MARLEDYPEFNGYITGLDEYGERYIPSGLTLRRRENERKALGLSKADYEDLVRQAEQEEEEVCQIIRNTLIRNGFVK